jgi:hypothetical protein
MGQRPAQSDTTQQSIIITIVLCTPSSSLYILSSNSFIPFGILNCFRGSQRLLLHSGVMPLVPNCETVNYHLVMRPRRGSTPRHTDLPTVSLKVTRTRTCTQRFCSQGSEHERLAYSKTVSWFLRVCNLVGCIKAKILLENIWKYDTKEIVWTLESQNYRRIENATQRWHSIFVILAIYCTVTYSRTVSWICHLTRLG